MYFYIAHLNIFSKCNMQIKYSVCWTWNCVSPLRKKSAVQANSWEKQIPVLPQGSHCSFAVGRRAATAHQAVWAQWKLISPKEAKQDLERIANKRWYLDNILSNNYSSLATLTRTNSQLFTIFTKPFWATAHLISTRVFIFLPHPEPWFAFS